MAARTKKAIIIKGKKLRNKLTPIHPVDILLSLCRGLASVGSSVGDSTARGSSRAFSGVEESSGRAMPTFSLGGGGVKGLEENSSTSASAPPPCPGFFGTLPPRLSAA